MYIRIHVGRCDQFFTQFQFATHTVTPICASASSACISPPYVPTTITTNKTCAVRKDADFAVERRGFENCCTPGLILRRLCKHSGIDGGSGTATGTATRPAARERAISGF